MNQWYRWRSLEWWERKKVTIVWSRTANRITMLTKFQMYPESKVHGANMGPIWVLSAPDGPHVGPMNLAIRVSVVKKRLSNYKNRVRVCTWRCRYNIWVYESSQYYLMCAVPNWLQLVSRGRLGTGNPAPGVFEVKPGADKPADVRSSGPTTWHSMPTTGGGDTPTFINALRPKKWLPFCGWYFEIHFLESRYHLLKFR